MTFDELRERHGDKAVEIAVNFMSGRDAADLFPDRDRLYKTLKGDREGIRATQVVFVGRILNELVQPFYGGDVQGAVYLLKAVNKLIKSDNSKSRIASQIASLAE